MFQNSDNLALFQEMGLVDAKRRSLIRGSGVNYSRFAPAVQPQEGAGHGQVRFLMFGRILREKGVLEFLEAARAVLERMLADLGGKEAEFALLGSAPAKNPTGVRKDSLTGPPASLCRVT